MARTDETELAVRLEARIKDFERNMERARKSANQNFKRIEKDAEQSTAKLESSFAKAGRNIGNSLKAGLAAGLTTATIGGMVKGLADVARGVATIGNEAKRAGVSIKAFQELSYVARQNRIEVDALVDGMKELNLRADEWIVTGKGPAAEAFTRLGFSASTLASKLADPSALLVEIIEKMERLDRASQIRVADEIFGGTGGERFVELLDRGAAGVRDLIQEANDLGLVLSDELIAKADEIDRRFQTITDTVSTGLKRAVIEVVDAVDDLLDGLRDVERQQDSTITSRLGDVFAERQAIMDRIAEMEAQDADPLSFFKNTNELKLARLHLAELTAEAGRLKDILDRRNGYPGTIEETGKQAQDAEPKVRSLASSIQDVNAAGATGSAGINSFANAIRALKGEIPGLADQLANMDAKMRIEGAYRAALQNARSIGDTLVAEQLRDQALAALSSAPAHEAASKSMLDLIGYAEGTDKGRGYNESLGYGAFTGGPRNLVGMTLDQIDALQTQMLRHPDNGFNSSALGRYQIVQKTLRGLRGELGLSGDEFFDASMQDRLAQQLLRRRGNDPAGLRNEWEGLRKVDSSLISQAYDGQSVAMPAVDPGIASARQADIDLAKQQAETYASIVQGANVFKQAQTLEAQALGLTTQAAQALRFEQDLLNQAQAAGIQLSPQQRAELQQLAQGMAEVEAATLRAANSQQEIQAMQQFLGGQIQGFFSSIITGSATAEQALQRLLGALVDAALQAALFGGGPFGALFGGGAGILDAVFGMKSGGVVKAATGGHIRGPGTGTSDSIPAMLSNGEYVINARATAKHHKLLEAINSGRVPAYAEGGLASARPVAAPSFSGAGAGSGGQNITISPVINMNAQGGDQKQNADLAAQTAKAAEQAIREIVAQELRTQLRPGGVLNGRR